VQREFNVTSRLDGQAAVLALGGELDLASHRSLEEAVGSALAAGSALVVLDLADLEFMDVAGLRSVLRAEQRARAAGAPLVLAGPSSGIRRLLALTRQRQALTVLGSVADALQRS
jgi:anti-anti-sigma factor